MDKRASKRVSEKLQIDFIYDNQMYEGTIKELSCHGLNIEANTCPPIESNLNIVLILGDEVFKLTGRIKRAAFTEGLDCSIGVELLKYSENYCDFVAIVNDFFYHKKIQ